MMEKEKVTQTPDMYALLYLHKVCGPETLQKQHSGQSHAHLICIAKEKQHSNMWETGSKSGCGRKERAHFHESHLKPMFHHCFFNRETRQLFRETLGRYRSEGILAVLLTWIFI